MIFDRSLTSSLVFGASETHPLDAREFTSEITFDQMLCLEYVSNHDLNSSLTFGNFLTAQGYDQPGGITDPPAGFEFPIIYRKRLANDIIFDNFINVTGGYLVDYSCNPPRLVPNISFVDWDTFTETEWDSFSDVEWDWFEGSP